MSVVAEERRKRPSGRWIPLLVIAAIAAFILVPVRKQLLQHSPPKLKPLTFAQLPPVPRIPLSARVPAGWSTQARTLVLYDYVGKWRWVGELDAIMASNLVGHFGPTKLESVADYRQGDVDRYRATVYLGSAFGDRLPKAFLDDVLATSRQVLWVASNIQQLEERAPDFRARYGWRTSLLDHSRVAEVRYKGRTLTRWTRQAAGIMGYAAVDRGRARVLAQAVRTDGSMFPWAVRSRNLTYVGEMPFQYTSESDRVLVFADLLFDALAPRAPERHRALVRLEDINPLSDAAELRAAADYLHSKGIPFGFGVSPYYRDPQDHEDGPHELQLRNSPKIVSAIKYMERKGGVLVGHGYTHQWDGGSNPYDGMTGDDVEFYRVKESAEGQVEDVGPLPGDSSPAWADHRIVAANRAFAAAGIAAPRIFEFPHYVASDHAYRAAARRFAVRWERSDYFAGLIHGPVDYRHVVGQFFPYVVHDFYGSKVLPENLGAIAPSTWHTYKARLPRDLIRAARANLVVRDGFASFYFHPFLPLKYLKQSVAGIEAAGYRFVSPTSL